MPTHMLGYKSAVKIMFNSFTHHFGLTMVIEPSAFFGQKILFLV